MRKKLFKNILGGLVVTLTICMAMMVLVLNKNFVNIEISQLSKEAKLASVGVERDGTKYLESIHDSDYRITWLDSDGSVLYDTEVNSATMENHSSREEFKAAITEGEGSSIRYSSTMLQQNIYYAIKLDDGTVLRVAETYDTVWVLMLKLLTPILWIYVFAIAISAVLSNYLGKKIAEPINAINLDAPLSNETYEEIQPLLKRVDSQNVQIKKQLDDLHQKKKEFETVSNSISEGLLLLNTDSKVLSVNQAAYQLFQCNDGNTIVQSDDIQDLITKVKQGKEAETTIRKDEAIIRIIANPIYSHSVFTGISILAFDVTNTYEAERTRREFTANVSHELKTPLQTIMGSAELLQNHLVKQDDIDTFYSNIHKESSRMLTLIDDIIRLSQLDESSEVEESILRLNDSAKEAIISLKDSASKKNIQIETKFEDAFIKANTRLIYEIVYNLIDNAIRYSNNDTSILVSTYTKNHMSCISVQDNGIGIPLEDQNRIFERFYRVDKSHSRATGGTGLGLSIVKHAVKISHGTIHLESELGKGSTFTVQFPKA
jgi:two-component system, OmpR family, phosphate regulon sensor histidine kinase PhoR